MAAKVGSRHMLFETPSGFSVFVKRLINPGRQADNGWQSVKYKGTVAI